MSLSLKDRIALKILGPWPIVKGYTVLEGMIEGPVRYETFQGDEKYIEPTSVDGLTYFREMYPHIDKEGRIWSVSAIQKKSKHGWLRTDPHAYFWWSMLRLQKKDAAGNWISGTEFGWYYRAPLVWRIDFPGTEIDGVLRNWVPSWGHAGPRYD